jgi:hypothetical protein
MARRRNRLYPHWSDERAHGVQRLLPAWEYKFPRQLAFVRALVGLWFVILTIILLGYQRGEMWAWVFVPCAALSFAGAWYIPRTVAALPLSSNAS